MSPSLFLTRDELYELTGYKLISKQAGWLRRKNWRFEITASGRPIVARSYVEAMLGGTKPAKEEERFKPNYDAIRPGR